MKMHVTVNLHGVYKVISIMTFDPWPPKSRGFIISPWLTCLPSSMKMQATVKSLSFSQNYFHICPLWTLTLKINPLHDWHVLKVQWRHTQQFIANRTESNTIIFRKFLAIYRNFLPQIDQKSPGLTSRLSPRGAPGLMSRMCPPYPHACRKRRLKWGAVI